MAETDTDKRLSGGVDVADEGFQRVNPVIIIIHASSRTCDQIAIIGVNRIREHTLKDRDIRKDKIGVADCSKHGPEHLRIPVKPVGDLFIDAACFQNGDLHFRSPYADSYVRALVCGYSWGRQRASLPAAATLSIRCWRDCPACGGLLLERLHDIESDRG